MKTFGYCVSAINKLTREREVVTPGCSLEKAQRVCNSVLSVRPHKRSYVYPRVDSINRHLEQKLKFDK